MSKHTLVRVPITGRAQFFSHTLRSAVARGSHRRARAPVGKQALELEFLKGGAAPRTPAEKCHHIRDCRPHGMSTAPGCELMSIARSTYYGSPSATLDDTALVAAITAICDEIEAYGWRRVAPPCGSRGWSLTTSGSGG